MKYVLELSDTFLADFNSAFDYFELELKNPHAADRLKENTDKVLESLSDNPFIYALYHNSKIAAKGYRYAIIGKHLLFYTVDESTKTVHASRFIYGGRNIPDMI